MIPVLYNSTRDLGETNVLESAGLGPLPDCVNCTVTRMADGQDEVQLVYPVDGRLFGELQNGRVLGLHRDATRRIQPYIIYRQEPNLDGTVTVYAYHASYALNFQVRSSTLLQSMAAAISYLAGAQLMPGQSWPVDDIYNAPFSFSADGVTLDTPLEIPTPTTVREAIRLLTAHIGCAVEYDQFDVTFRISLGSDDGVTIRYGGSLTSAQREYDTSEGISAVAPYWLDSSSGVVFPARADQFVVEQEPPESGRFPGQYIRKAVPLDMSDTFETRPTTEALTTAAQNYLANNKPWTPADTFVVSFVPYDPDHDATQAAAQSLQLYDTVHVVIPPLNANVAMGVVKTTYNVLLDRYDSIEVGQSQTTLSDIYAPRTADGSAAPVTNALKVVQTAAYNPGTLAAGATFSNTAIDVSETGWTPIGVVGWRVNVQDILIRTMRINNDGNLEIEGKNVGSASRNPGIYARILYLRVGS